MFAKRLQHLFIPPVGKFIPSTGKSPTSGVLFWFSLSMTCAGAISLLALRQAFSSEFMVHDDARQHVFWMQRFIDPGLFPGDLIADYFQSVSPLGYSALYRAMAAIGISPMLFSKLLPAILGLVSTAYSFGVTLQILPVPLAGFLSSLLLNQSLMMGDDLYSATPRAFLYPLFLAFLYYFLRRDPKRSPHSQFWLTSLLPGLVVIGLQSLFYPPAMFIACGVLVLSLGRWDARGLHLSTQRRDYWFCGLGLVVAAIGLLPFILEGGSTFGPLLNATQAKQMPELWESGRSSFFSDNPFTFWLFGERSGMLPRLDRLFLPPLLLMGLALPWLLRSPQRFPLVQQITSAKAVFLATVLSSLGLFFVAHAVLFKLHLPNRYTQHSFRILIALAAGISLTILLDALVRWANRGEPGKQRVDKRPGKALAAWSITGLVILLLVMYPAIVQLRTVYPIPRGIGTPLPGYIAGNPPELFRFFAQQPKDTLIASTLLVGNNVPSFSYRSVLVGREYAIPYHQGYYQQFRSRVIDQIQAQYSTDPTLVKGFVEKYGIDFWLVNANAFTPNYLQKSWLKQYQPLASNAANALKQGMVPVVQQAIARCTILQAGEFSVLSAKCVAGEKGESESPSMAQ